MRAISARPGQKSRTTPELAAAVVAIDCVRQKDADVALFGRRVVANLPLSCSAQPLAQEAPMPSPIVLLKRGYTALTLLE